MLLNGDRITGEVKEVLLGRLRYKTDNLSQVHIEWDKVASVTAKGRFEVELQSGVVLFGEIGPGPAPAEMTITLDTGSVVHAHADIVRITAIKSTFWGRVDGKPDLGATFNQASEIAQFSFHGDALLKRPSFWAGVELDSIFTQQQEVEDTQRHRASGNYFYLFANRWVSLTKLIFEQNRELGFRLRTSVELGAGKFLVQSNRTVLLTGLGAQVNRERPTEGARKNDLRATVSFGYIF